MLAHAPWSMTSSVVKGDEAIMGRAGRIRGTRMCGSSLLFTKTSECGMPVEARAREGRGGGGRGEAVGNTMTMNG